MVIWGCKVDTDFDVEGRNIHSEKEVSEASLRKALERLGAGQQQGRRSSGAGSGMPHRSAPENRRRRFVQDGQVVVEHHQPSRHAMRTAASVNTEDQQEITRLRQLLKIEQRRAEDGARDVHEAQAQIRSIETHLVHAKLHAQELEGVVKEKDSIILDLNVRLQMQAEQLQARAVQTQEDPIEEVKIQVRKPRKKRVAAETTVEAEDEPQPVQWWKD